MIRITIIADRVEELRQFLQREAEKPNTFKTLGDLQWPPGSYKPRHAKKTGTADGRPRYGNEKRKAINSLAQRDCNTRTGGKTRWINTR